MTPETKEIQSGNIIMSKYLYGEPEITGLYQIGYEGIYKVYRNSTHIYSDTLKNFHNDWTLLHDVIAKIAKEDVEDFSKEDILQAEIKNTMFEFSYDIMLNWYTVLKYIKLKLTI